MIKKRAKTVETGKFSRTPQETTHKQSKFRIEHPTLKKKKKKRMSNIIINITLISIKNPNNTGKKSSKWKIQKTSKFRIEHLIMIKGEQASNIIHQYGNF